MRDRSTFLLIAVLTLVSTAAFSQVEFPMKATVPFAYTAGSTTIPAGTCEYRMVPSRNRLSIECESAHTIVVGGFMHYKGGREGLAVGKKQTELVFVRFGDERFLSAAWISNQGLSFQKPKRQKELEKQGQKGEEETFKVGG